MAEGMECGVGGNSVGKLSTKDWLYWLMQSKHKELKMLEADEGADDE